MPPGLLTIEIVPSLEVLVLFTGLPIAIGSASVMTTVPVIPGSINIVSLGIGGGGEGEALALGDTEAEGE